MNTAALAVLLKVVCAEALTVVGESPGDFNYFNSRSGRSAEQYEPKATNGASLMNGPWEHFYQA